MAFTTEFTQPQIDALTRSIALGIRRVEHNGKMTEFQSIEAMIALRDRMKAEISAASASAPMPCMTRRTIYVRG